MKMNMFDLSNKVAIVTGGNRGIGLAIARGFAGAGATVVIANRKAAEGEKAAEALRREGLNAVAIPTDVSKMDSVQSLVSKAVHDFGKIDILVDNAGLMVRKPVEEITEEDWDSVINTNLVKVMVNEIREGRRTPETAAKVLAPNCSCGVFNPVRAAELLEAVASK